MVGKRTARVAYVSLGCRVNRVETDAIALQLERAGCVMAQDEREAQAVVLNTCAVTGEAQAKTRKAVRHAASMPQNPLVVATGCVASLFSNELASLGDNVVVEADRTKVTQRVLEGLERRGQLTPAGQSGDDIAAEGHGHDAVTPTGRTRPGIKVQDGCDLRCSYCIVWKARGASRSVDADEVVRQVRDQCDAGAREVMLTGINLGRYAAMRDGVRMGLAELLEEVLERTDVGRVRLGSIEPQDVDGRLAQLIASSGGRIAPFLHMCLQSGCDATLARMRRVYDTALFAERVEIARSCVPGISLGTDLIVGFPGETEDEFGQSMAFCERMRFSRMHVFRYSKRPGTPAATMEGQVDPQVMAKRADRAHLLSGQLRLAEARAAIGSRDRVVAQAPGAGITGGLFDAVLDEPVPVGSLVDVRITGVRDGATLTCTVVP